jgi:hypothetical protein
MHQTGEESGGVARLAVQIANRNYRWKVYLAPGLQCFHHLKEIRNIFTSY